MALTAEQQQIRKSRIGSSDISAIVGTNPFRRPIDVFMEKTGLSEGFHGNWRTEVGNALEPVIAGWHASQVGATKLVQGQTTVHPNEDWIVATPDYHLFFEGGAERIAEVKNVGRNVAHHWDLGVPDYVACQVHWQQETTCKHLADVVASIGEDEPQSWQIEDSPEIRESLVEIGRDFWFEHVLKNIPPEIEGTEQYATYLTSTLKRHNSTMVQAPPDAEKWVEQRRDAMAAKKDAEVKILEAKNHLEVIAGENGGIYSDSWRAKWVDIASGGTDWKALATKLGASKQDIEQFKRPGYKYLGVWEKK